MSKTHLGLPAEQDAGGTGSPEAPRNGYLEGPFASVAQEVTAYGLRVTGEIPRELNGRFLRVEGNPSPVDPEDPRTYNWFIGSGMVFGVRLREGRAEWYRNRFVRDDRISQAMHLPRVPGPDQLSRREPYREKKGPRYVEANVTNTHVFAVNGRTYAFAEAGVLPMELTYELETVARSDFGGTLNGAWTGHPHRDPVTGELHGIAYFWQWDHASYQVLGTDGTITKRVDVPLTGPSTIHDMAFTEKYAVFLAPPRSSGSTTGRRRCRGWTSGSPGGRSATGTSAPGSATAACSSRPGQRHPGVLRPRPGPGWHRDPLRPHVGDQRRGRRLADHQRHRHADEHQRGPRLPRPGPPWRPGRQDPHPAPAQHRLPRQLDRRRRA